jgi:hypothetical protein
MLWVTTSRPPPGWRPTPSATAPWLRASRCAGLQGAGSMGRQHDKQELAAGWQRGSIVAAARAWPACRGGGAGAYQPGGRRQGRAACPRQPQHLTVGNHLREQQHMVGWGAQLGGMTVAVCRRSLSAKACGWAAASGMHLRRRSHERGAALRGSAQPASPAKAAASTGWNCAAIEHRLQPLPPPRQGPPNSPFFSCFPTACRATPPT